MGRREGAAAGAKRPRAQAVAEEGDAPAARKPRPAPDAVSKAKKKKVKAKPAAAGDGGGAAATGSAAAPAKRAAVERPDAASLPLAEQAQWLWESYKTESGGGSYLEADAFSPSTLLRLPPPPPPAAGSVGDSGSNSAVGLFGRLQAALGPGCASALSPPASAPAGSPCVLVVAGAALRCLELLRSLPEAARRGPGAKLFGKHLKAADQAAALGRAPVGVAVGTPARLATLAAGGGLRLDGLRLVVLDCGRDLKLRCVLDIPETRRDFWALWRGCLAARVAAGHTKVALL